MVSWGWVEGMFPKTHYSLNPSAFFLITNLNCRQLHSNPQIQSLTAGRIEMACNHLFPQIYWLRVSVSRKFHGSKALIECHNPAWLKYYYNAPYLNLIVKITRAEDVSLFLRVEDARMPNLIINFREGSSIVIWKDGVVDGQVGRRTFAGTFSEK